MERVFPGFSYSFPVITRSPSRPSFEGVGEGELVIITYRLGDGFHLVVSGCQVMHCTAHAEVGDLLDRAAAELFLAEATEVFRAEAADFSQILQSPGTHQVLLHRFPYAPESVVPAVGFGGTVDEPVDEFHPVVELSWFRRIFAGRLDMEACDSVV